jgi:hypothetical protein
VCLLYGLALELREEGNRPLRSSIEMFDVNLARTATSTPFPDSPFLALVGVDLAPYRSTSDRRLLLFTSSRVEEPSVLDKIPIRLRIAGYAPVQTTFDAQPVHRRSRCTGSSSVRRPRASARSCSSSPTARTDARRAEDEALALQLASTTGIQARSRSRASRA